MANKQQGSGWGVARRDEPESLNLTKDQAGANMAARLDQPQASIAEDELKPCKSILVRQLASLWRAMT